MGSSMSRIDSIKKSKKLKHEAWANDLMAKVSKEELASYYNEHSKPDTCLHFGLPNSSISFLLKAYGIHKDKSKIVEIREKTCVAKYGVTNTSMLDSVTEKRKRTCIQRYGKETNFGTDDFWAKSKQTCLEKYGTEYANQSDSVKSKIKDGYIESFGSVENAYKHISNVSMVSRERHYGSVKESYKVGIENQSQVVLERYGVPYACMRKEARVLTNNSAPNKAFAEMLECSGIAFDTEFPIDRCSFDFKVGNNLIEIDPSATHNSTWGIFNVGQKKSPDYHSNKTELARNSGFRCIHVFDWDDPHKIIELLLPRQSIYARECKVCEVEKEVVDAFLNDYHLQGTCRGQIFAYGLYFNGTLVEVMTFGKARYNSKCNYELLRLVTLPQVSVVGGASRLFTKFVSDVPAGTKIVSYCDNSKFNGEVYEQLGFDLISRGHPTKHWYNMSTKKHITDNLLRQQGADRLIGTSFGKGYDNEDILRDNKFVEIYDCGQSTYIYEKH